MNLVEHYSCPSCAGTGEIESADSTDDRWWDCPICKGTGKLKDRRRPDPQLKGAVKALQDVAAPNALTDRDTRNRVSIARAWLKANGYPTPWQRGQ